MGVIIQSVGTCLRDRTGSSSELEVQCEAFGNGIFSPFVDGERIEESREIERAGTYKPPRSILCCGWENGSGGTVIEERRRVELP